jgi:protein-S-isoprenylcysteine O-methyltransferase Ste14
VIAAAAGVVQVALARRSRPSRWSLAAAAPVAGFACWLIGDALVRFRRSDATVDPISPDRASTLVVAGANTVSRNPMYLAMAAVLFAHAVARRSPAALVPVAGFVAVLTRGQIAAEEHALTDRFGDAYLRYRAEVPRWVDARSLSLATSSRLRGRSGVRGSSRA